MCEGEETDVTKAEQRVDRISLALDFSVALVFSLPSTLTLSLLCLLSHLNKNSCGVYACLSGVPLPLSAPSRPARRAIASVLQQKFPLSRPAAIET
jgi:hypothetical protein